MKPNTLAAIIAAMIALMCLGQGSELSINVSENNITATIDGEPVHVGSLTEETDVFAEEMAWVKSEQYLTEDEYYEQVRLSMESYGWSEWYITTIGQRARLTYAPKFGMMLVERQFGIDSIQNETEEELRQRIMRNISDVSDFSLPVKYWIRSVYDLGFGPTAVMDVTYYIPYGDAIDMHRTYEEFASKEERLRDHIGSWFWNV